MAVKYSVTYSKYIKGPFTLRGRGNGFFAAIRGKCLYWVAVAKYLCTNLISIPCLCIYFAVAAAA